MPYTVFYAEKYTIWGKKESKGLFALKPKKDIM